jgi:hypothetical protein
VTGSCRPTGDGIYRTFVLHKNAGHDRPVNGLRKSVEFRISFCGGDNRGDFAALSHNMQNNNYVMYFIYIYIYKYGVNINI